MRLAFGIPEAGPPLAGWRHVVAAAILALAVVAGAGSWLAASACDGRIACLQQLADGPGPAGATLAPSLSLAEASGAQDRADAAEDAAFTIAATATATSFAACRAAILRPDDPVRHNCGFLPDKTGPPDA